mgnify:CR=1 FL=1
MGSSKICCGKCSHWEDDCFQEGGICSLKNARVDYSDWCGCYEGKYE